MAKKIEQVRFYSNKDESQQNQPKGLTSNRLVSGSIFNEKYPIIQLGIQTLPGVKFYLNHSLTPIMVGATGIYDLDLEGMTEINHLCFSAASMNLINANPDSYLIVDFIYDKEE